MSGSARKAHFSFWEIRSRASRPAPQLARRNVGTPVFGGMILASFIGIFAIPPLYVTFQWIAEKLRRGPAKESNSQEKAKDAHAPERFSPGAAE